MILDSDMLYWMFVICGAIAIITVTIITERMYNWGRR